MDSPVRKQQKRNDYLRHKMFRKIKRRRKAEQQQAIDAPAKELRRRLRRRTFKCGKDAYKGGKDNDIVPFKQREEVIITPDVEYNAYLNTLPDNQRFTPNDAYDSYYYWQLNGKPKDFVEAYNKGMFTYDNSDGMYHANSVAFGKDGNGHFMKPKTHDTVGYELDWYNNGTITEEGGKQHQAKGKEKREWQKFKKEYELVDDPDRPNFYMYRKRSLKKPKFAPGKDDDDIIFGEVPYPLYDQYGNLLDLNTGAIGTTALPNVEVVANPEDVARGNNRRAEEMAKQWYKDFGTESNDATSVAGGRRQNSHLDGRGRSIPWDANPVLNTIGLGLSTVPFAVAAYPVAAGAGELAYGLGNWVAATRMGQTVLPYADAALTSVFAAHGLNHAINEGIADWKDAAMTTLEVSPLGRLFTPLSKTLSSATGSVTDFFNNAYRGRLRQVRNQIFPKEHYGTMPSLDEYLQKAEADKILASDISQVLNEPGRYLYRGQMDKTIEGSKFTKKELPVSVQIDGDVVSGTATQYEYGGGHSLYKPKYGNAGTDGGRRYMVTFDSDAIPTEYASIVNEDSYRRFLVENDEAFNQAILDNIRKIEQESGAPVVGSSRLISEGYVGGVPGDVEIIVPKSRLKQVSDRLKFNQQRTTAGDTGVTGYSEDVLRGGETNNLDINVMDDTGTIIHQMESTRMPDKMPQRYSELAKRQQGVVDNDAITRSADLKIPKEDGSGYYTAEEYYNLIKDDPELLTQSVIDNAFKSNKDKHVGRAFVMMNSDNPKTIQQVSNAIDHMVSQVPGMQRFSEIYKSQSFTNIEKNKEILQKIGFAPMDVEKFASNPQQMKNIVDYWYMRKTVGTRGVNFEPLSTGDTYENVMSPVRTYDNGDGSGGGGNTILGSPYGAYTRRHTSYSEYQPIVDKNTATFDDVFNAFDREEKIWSQQDQSVINDAIEKVAKDFNIDPNKVRNYSGWGNESNFTTNITKLVDKGELTHEEANQFIINVAKELNVSGFRGSSYSGKGGSYFGAMKKPERVAYRNIDQKDMHNQPMLPAEFGSDDMFFLNKTRAGRYGPHHPVEFGDVSTEEVMKQYPENIIDLLPYRKLADEIIAANAEDDFASFYLSGYDPFTLDKASGLEEARNHYRKMGSTYAKRQKQILDLKLARQERAAKIRNIKRDAIAYGSVSVPVAGAGMYIYEKNKENNLWYDSPEYQNYVQEINELVSKHDEDWWDEDQVLDVLEKHKKQFMRRYNKERRDERRKKRDAKRNKKNLNKPHYASGKDSGIHIKPENRGKFTRLKKRTGKSASWFKAHGTPAQKKMATFALNARKWKHK